MYFLFPHCLLLVSSRTVCLEPKLLREQRDRSLWMLPPEGDVFKGKVRVNGPLIALLSFFFPENEMNTGAQTPCGLQARLSLPCIPRGYGKVGCQKNSQGIANPLPASCTSNWPGHVPMGHFSTSTRFHNFLGRKKAAATATQLYYSVDCVYHKGAV